MSLFGAMTTAISGLSAQSAAFGNIGDNLANTQTVGYKRIGTSFDDLLSQSSATVNQSGAVVATPDYNNTVQGAISQSDSPLNLAISGQGFLSVSFKTGESNGVPTFRTEPQYTREGDFKLNKDGYLVNSTGHYLNGWVVDPITGQLNTTSVQTLQVGQSGYSPVATSQVKLAANLPANPSSTSAPMTTPMPVYDGLGKQHDLALTWTKGATAGNWSLDISNAGTSVGTWNVVFGTTPTDAGKLVSITPSTGTASPGNPATLGFSTNFGVGAQNITLNLGTYGGTDGVTQYDGAEYNLISLSQDGVKPGSFSSVTMKSSGDVVVNYDNGQSRTVARVPVVTFANADALQREDGQAFSATTESGAAQTRQAGSNGAGNLVTSSVEASNVDIASEFTKLIVAQRAYSANTKMVTTADELLQQTIDMKR